MNEQSFRNSLVELLKEGHAHVSIKDALAGIEAQDINIRPTGMDHSLWEVTEHIRLAQEDILRYALDANWVSPKFPEGYWPAKDAQASADDWQRSIKLLFADLDEVIALTENSNIDLTAEIPHGSSGHTYLREILLVADHNAYHAAQVVQIRKALGKWHN